MLPQPPLPDVAAAGAEPPRPHLSAFIHPKAHVDGASLGACTHVWQFASVIRGATLGAGCTVAANAIVDAARLGDDCSVGHAASVHPGARIGNGVFIGPGAIIANDAWPRTRKEGFDFAALQRGDTISVEIGDGASIGAGAIVLPGVRIGAGAMVAAGVTVERDVPPWHVFHRGGGIEPITPEIEAAKLERRMRTCSMS